MSKTMVDLILIRTELLSCAKNLTNIKTFPNKLPYNNPAVQIHDTRIKYMLVYVKCCFENSTRRDGICSYLYDRCNKIQ
jgi:hypothetical protein